MKRSGILRATKITAWGLSLLSMVLIGGGTHPPPLKQQLAVPAYWTPEDPTGRALFQQLAVTGNGTGAGAGSTGTGIVVINGSHSAPEVPYNQAWADTFHELAGAGVRALGYVDTGYLGIDFGQSAHATRATGPGAGASTSAAWIAQIEADADDWYALYGASGLRGIFLDQTAAVCGPDDAYVAMYRSIAEHIREAHPGAYVVMNPGRAMDRCYEPIADTFVTFEGPYAEYLTRKAPAWEATAPADKFWHLVYGATDQASMTNAIALSKQRNAGYVYVTNGILTPNGETHPWDGLPPRAYLSAELAAALNRDFPSVHA